jgi:hypothetical protein
MEFDPDVAHDELDIAGRQHEKLSHFRQRDFSGSERTNQLLASRPREQNRESMNYCRPIGIGMHAIFFPVNQVRRQNDFLDRGADVFKGVHPEVFRIEDMKELLNLGYALFIKRQAARGLDDVSDIDRFPIARIFPMGDGGLEGLGTDVRIPEVDLVLDAERPDKVDDVLSKSGAARRKGAWIDGLLVGNAAVQFDKVDQHQSVRGLTIVFGLGK